MEHAVLETGPCCPCHGTRNMERMGYCLYRCQRSGDTFRMLLRDGFPAMVPLRSFLKLCDFTSSDSQKGV